MHLTWLGPLSMNFQLGAPLLGWHCQAAHGTPPGQAGVVTCLPGLRGDSSIRLLAD